MPRELLNLTNKVCRFGKISNNLEHHGNEWVTAFTIPIAGLLIDKDELNTLMQDKHCHASWFDTSGRAFKPMPWWGEDEFALSGSYQADELAITISGGRELKFTAQEPDDPDDEDDVGRPACEITGITLKPQPGGEVEMRFKLTLRPGVGQPNLKLQEHQHREVKLTISDTSIIERKERQQQLPIGGPGGGAAAGGDGASSAKH